MNALVALLSLGVFIFLFFLPSLVAIGRNHPEKVSIILWNTVGMFLFGLGWFIALVKALSTPRQTHQTVIVQNVVSAQAGTSKD